MGGTYCETEYEQFQCRKQGQSFDIKRQVLNPKGCTGFPIEIFQGSFEEQSNQRPSRTNAKLKSRKTESSDKIDLLANIAACGSLGCPRSMWFTCAEVIHSLREYHPGDWLTALKLSEYASYNVPESLSAGPPVHQFWWLVPLNNHPVQADKRVITRSTCGWIVEEKEGELSRAGPALSPSSSHHSAAKALQFFGGREISVEFSLRAEVPTGCLHLGGEGAGWEREDHWEAESVFFGARIFFWKRLGKEGQFCIASQ